MPLKVPKVIITAGATEEALDPVRFITNKSSGKQGYAIAEVFFLSGFDVYLVSGSVDSSIKNSIPKGIKILFVKTANEMLKACEDLLPANVFISTAAVCDWLPVFSTEKIKKIEGQEFIDLRFTKNTNVLCSIANHKKLRPNLVFGFAAETKDIIKNAKSKLIDKNCDYIIANDVSLGRDVFGNDNNEVFIIGKNFVENLDLMSKKEVAKRLFAIAKENLQESNLN